MAKHKDLNFPINNVHSMANNQENPKVLKSKYVPSAEFYSQIIDSLQDYSIFTLDKEFNLNSWSSGSTKILVMKLKR